MCSTPSRDGTARLIVSPLACASASSDGRASCTRLRSSSPRSATRRMAGPGRRRPRSPSCSTRPRRSSALTRREAVLFGIPLADASSVNATGSSDSSTRTSSSAPRAIAVVPGAGPSASSSRDWNCCSTVVILRPKRSASSHDQREPALYVNAMPRSEILSEDAMDVLDRGWRRIVSELGIEFLLPEAVELLRDAGQIVEDENRVRFDPEWILEQVAKAPSQFDLQARNPANTVTIGGDDMVFGPVYGCPFIREGEVRRDAKMADFENLVRLAPAFRALD